MAARLLSETLARNPTPSRESELLRSISEGHTADFWTRKAALDQKAEASTLTPAGDDERLAVLSQMERWQVARLESVLKLAQLRGESPQTVMERLEILPV